MGPYIWGKENTTPEICESQGNMGSEGLFLPESHQDRGGFVQSRKAPLPQ